MVIQPWSLLPTITAPPPPSQLQSGPLTLEEPLGTAIREWGVPPLQTPPIRTPTQTSSSQGSESAFSGSVTQFHTFSV